ncbi:MAG TPA: FusB/FusC family EF-G-binding protein [Bacillota bacterium]|nr:FusB/FusC family EF-G-binding protein [Bacillota bacterium]
MVEPFMRNHQYNLIKKQVGIVQRAFHTALDPKVLEAVRYSAEDKIIEAFATSTDREKQILQRISDLSEPEEFQQYLHSLEPYIVEFPNVTENQLKKLFPKNKKLKIPDLSTIEYRKLTYLGWLDISITKWFMVYRLNDQIIGIEGKYTPTNKKDVCSLCKGHGEVALVTAISKTRPANSSPDYYKAVGNYMCINSKQCNGNITDVSYLERFIQNVIG